MNRPINGKSQRYESIPPEAMEVAKAYTFSINPTVCTGDLTSDYKILTKLIRTFLDIRGLEMAVFPEYSFHGKLHAHGSFKCNNVIAIGRFYEKLYQLRSKCSYEVDFMSETRISDKYADWSEYCFKCKHIMNPLLKSVGLPYKITP